MTGIDLRADLEEWMESDFDFPIDPEEDRVFETPKDERTVNGMLRALAASQREIHRIDEIAADEMSRIKTWQSDRTSGLRRRIADLERVLESYARQQLEGRTKNKQLTYPNGALKLRGHSARPSVVDESAYTAWVKADDEKGFLVETTTKVKLQDLGRVVHQGPELDELIDDDGVVWQRWAAVFGDDEIVPGVEIRKQKSDGFSASPA